MNKSRIILIEEAAPLQPSRLEVIYADEGYSGKLEEELPREFGVETCTIKKQTGVSGAAKTMGRRENLCLLRQIHAPEQGL